MTRTIPNGARFSDAAERNKAPLLRALRDILVPESTVLEVASGSGQHAAFLAPALRVHWQPTDRSEGARDSIAAWTTAEAATAWVKAPAFLDVTEHPWPVAAADALVCFNMIHIAPAAATTALFLGAADRLPAGAPLVLYGPFQEEGKPMVASNVAFDAHLRAMDPAFGVRALSWVVAQGNVHGFSLAEVVRMPANNLVLLFRRTPN